MQYLFVDITATPCSSDTTDVLCAMLAGIGYDAFEQGDTDVKAYIPLKDFNEALLIDTLNDIVMPEVTFTYSIHELEEKDWNTEWEQHGFDPILEKEFGIKLHPRMAFGSGTHPTTHQLVAMLFQQDFKGQRVLDMGTGTGVLGIAMATRDAQEVVAIDIDPFSVENARENFALNNIHHAQILLGDASAISGTFHTIVANIHKNILRADMPTYAKHLAPHGLLLISGFFTEDVPDMEKAATQFQLSISQVVETDGWAIMALSKS